ncbi:hypothetical protein STANM309S_06286 [Streptomyces tanashiensis]
MGWRAPWAGGSLAFAHAHHPPLKSGENPLADPARLPGTVALLVIDLGQVGFWQLSGGWQWLATVFVLLGGGSGDDGGGGGHADPRRT